MQSITTRPPTALSKDLRAPLLELQINATIPFVVCTYLLAIGRWAHVGAQSTSTDMADGFSTLLNWSTHE